MLGRRIFCGLSVLTLSGALAGCGFHPVFQQGGQAPGTSEALSQIEVALIPERSGQLLREELQKRFDGAGGPARKFYELTTSLSLSDDAVAIYFGTSSPSRIRVTAIAHWSLLALGGEPRTIASGWVKSIDGFNQVDTQYFYSEMQREQVIRRIASNLADQMVLELAAHFNKEQKSE
jgi:LPS-assembly lipoprotein